MGTPRKSAPHDDPLVMPGEAPGITIAPVTRTKDEARREL